MWSALTGMDGTEGKAWECLCCCAAVCVRVLQGFGSITSDAELWLLIFPMWQMQTPFQLGLLLQSQRWCLGHGSGGLAHQEWWGDMGRSDPALWLEQREMLDVCEERRHLCHPSGSFSTLNWLAKVRLKLSVLINKASVDGVQAKPVNSLYLWISVCYSIYIKL